MKPHHEYNAMSDAELTLARDKARVSHSRVRALKRGMSWFAGISASLNLIMAPILGHYSDSFPVFDKIEGFAIVLSLGTVAIAALAEKSRAKKAQCLELLTPLSESSHCRATLSLIERSAGAHAVHNEVMSMSRQLYVFDLRAMEAARTKEVQDRGSAQAAIQAQAEAEACRKLHGISV